MADAEDFLARYRREETNRRKTAEETLRYVSGALRLMGVKEVFAEFDGASDQGSIGELEFHPSPSAGVPDGLAAVIENAFYDLLPGGWEINEGSNGSIALETATGKVDVDQEWREASE